MIGLDVGSTTAKAAYPEGKFRIVESRNWRELTDGIAPCDIVSTGYFRKSVPHKLAITEITAAAFGAREYFPDAEVIVDIGGQDTKVIDLRNNTFLLNDKCSAGTGAFLEFTAKYLGIQVSELGDLHMRAKKAAQLNSTCGVFAISEMISRMVEGASVEDVVAGMHYSFARRVAKLIPEADRIVLIGGTVKNRGLTAALEEVAGKRFLIPPAPQTVNALGALRYSEERP
ncbi:MAG TPA: 2-hydroxyglutaryl-CoA dehydratase [Candidatus Methanoperedenaceae archaeon]|nr:2-hydroxyglutaryl-CoA dehydratase [Candidatus Methanoperedenaceae archaeon]